MNNWEIAKLAMNTGCKISSWGTKQYVFYREGVWYDEDSVSCDPNFSPKFKWEIYQEKPKKVKKVYYRGYSTVADEQDVIYETTFMSDKNKLLKMLTTHQIIKIEEKEFEV